MFSYYNLEKIGNISKTWEEAGAELEEGRVGGRALRVHCAQPGDTQEQAGSL